MGILWENIGKALQDFSGSSIEEYGMTCISYMDLYNEIEEMAHRKEDCNLSGAKCAVLCDRSIEALKLLLFCWRMDMVAVPMSFHYGEDNIRGILESTKPDIILSDRENIDFADIPVYTWENLPEAVFDITADEQLKDIEVLMCTSGTTGKPKASMLTGFAAAGNAKMIVDYFSLTQDDKILIGRPLYHCGVLIGEVIVSLLQGVNIMFYSAKFNPLMIGKILDKEGITVMCGTPTLLKAVAEFFIHKRKTCGLKTVAVYGETLLPEYVKTMKSAFEHTRIFSGYGLTESGTRVTYLDNELAGEKSGSVGKVLKGIEIRIVGDNGDCNLFETGKVVIKTPTVMKGYYNNAAETEKKLKDSWLDTGDLGYLDEDGYLYIAGRSDDMIVKSGLNVYPQEVENKLLKVPEVEEAMVYGELVNDVVQICADVVIDENYQQCDSQYIMNCAAEILPPHLMPYRLNIVEQLPKNGSGKKLRPRIKRQMKS